MEIKKSFEKGEKISHLNIIAFGLLIVDSFQIVENISDQITIEEINQNNYNIKLYKLNGLTLSQGLKNKKSQSLGVAITEKFDTLVKGNKVIARRPSGFVLRLAEDNVWSSPSAENILEADTIEELNLQISELK